MSNRRAKLIHQRNYHLREHLVKSIAQVSHLFLLQFATHFASKGGAAELKMMDCPKWAATEIL